MSKSLGSALSAADVDDLVSPAEAARIRGVTRQTISILIKNGRLQTRKIGGRKFLSRKDVENYRPIKTGRPRKLLKPLSSYQSRIGLFHEPEVPLLKVAENDSAESGREYGKTVRAKRSTRRRRGR